MAQFVRIKNYFFNLESLAYVRLEEKYIQFGFAYPVEPTCGQNSICLERGTHLLDEEFEQVKEYLLQLPDPDRIIVV
jgi:hypothetical protein